MASYILILNVHCLLWHRLPIELAITSLLFSYGSRYIAFITFYCNLTSTLQKLVHITSAQKRPKNIVWAGFEPLTLTTNARQMFRGGRKQIIRW